MNCVAVERWLEEGMPAGGAAAARTHAVSCPLCGPRVAAAARVESLLASAARGTPPAPAGFADRVLARIEAERAPRPHAAAPPVSASNAPRVRHGLAWWIRAAADPAIPSAVAFATFLLGVTEAGLLLARHPGALPRPALDWSAARGALAGTPFTQAVAWTCALGLVLLASWRLFHVARRSVVIRTHRW